jgi:hypothetical protein
LTESAEHKDAAHFSANLHLLSRISLKMTSSASSLLQLSCDALLLHGKSSDFATALSRSASPALWKLVLLRAGELRRMSADLLYLATHSGIFFEWRCPENKRSTLYTHALQKLGVMHSLTSLDLREAPALRDEALPHLSGKAIFFCSMV